MMYAIDPTSDTDNNPDQQLLDWVIAERTCEWCDQTYSVTLTRTWCCRTEPEKKTKHWKNWRVCCFCRACSGYDFPKFVFPLIRNIDTLRWPDLSALLTAQPMDAPAGNVFYSNVVHNVAEVVSKYIGYDVSDARIVHAIHDEITIEYTVTPPVTPVDVRFTITPDGCGFDISADQTPVQV